MVMVFVAWFISIVAQIWYYFTDVYLVETVSVASLLMWVIIFEISMWIVGLLFHQTTRKVGHGEGTSDVGKKKLRTYTPVKRGDK